MKRNIFACFLMSAFLMTTACSHKKDEKKKDAKPASASYEVTQERVDKVTESWPQSSQSAIKDLTSKYGLPDAVTEEMVMWKDTEPFKRSIVFREEIIHRFPIEHSDILAQTIDYRVPLDKTEAINQFDGSLLIDRTRGELTARNHRQEMNFLLFNLADKIVRGEMTVEQARREYSKNAEQLMSGTTNKMLTGLNFKTQGNTSDPDSMMQSMEANDQSSIQKEPKAEEVDVIIIEEQEEKESPAPTEESSESMEESSDSMEDSTL